MTIVQKETLRNNVLEFLKDLTIFTIGVIANFAFYLDLDIVLIYTFGTTLIESCIRILS